MRSGTYLKGRPTVQRIVLVGAQLGITDIGFQCFVVEMKFVVADDAISRTELRKGINNNTQTSRKGLLTDNRRTK